MRDKYDPDRGSTWLFIQHAHDHYNFGTRTRQMNQDTFTYRRSYANALLGRQEN